MNRYLIHFSYIGSSFKCFTRNPTICDKTSIEGVIYEAIKELKPKNTGKLLTASRTDARVHALNSTLQIDLESKNGNSFALDRMQMTLNKILRKENREIVINNVEIVPNDFDCSRSPIERIYLYRIAILRNNIGITNLFHSIPLDEINRCYHKSVIRFDANEAKEAAQLLIGRHDFRTFMQTNNEQKTKRPSFAIRRINSISIEPSQSLTVINIPNNPFEYWNIHIHAKSFVYRQVRRIIGTLIAVAEGKISKEDVYTMLTCPSKYSWNVRVRPAPAHGLYLTKINYPNLEK